MFGRTTGRRSVRSRLAGALGALLLAATTGSVPLVTAAEPLANSVAFAAPSSPGVKGPVIGSKVVAKKSKAVRDLPANSAPISRGNPLQGSPGGDPSGRGRRGRAIPWPSSRAGERALNQLSNPIRQRHRLRVWIDAE